MHSFDRRRFLSGGSSLIALPLLESFGHRAFAAGAKVPPKRMIFLGMGFGVTRETWFPHQAETGADYQLPPGLAMLERHKSDFTVIQNLTNQFSNEAHWGSTFWLTGANRYAVPGQSFSNTISVDQVAAETLGRDTRFTSIQLDCRDAKNSGHGPGLSLAWNRQGKPVAALDTPVAAFHRLFAEENSPLAERQAALLQRRSVLDTVLEDAKSAKRGLTARDKDKLDEYFQSIRDIEIRLAKEEQWLDVPKTRPEGLKTPPAKASGLAEMKLMYDIMLAAFQVDATRVFSYRQPVQSMIASFGASISAHNMSHYNMGERMDVSKQRDDMQSELLAGFIDRLKAVEETDGSRLFDHVTIALGSNISSIHYLNNCPTLVAGGGAGLKHGRHLVQPEKTPLCNLWLSLLRGSGIEVEAHGDSTGVIEELFA